MGMPRRLQARSISELFQPVFPLSLLLKIPLSISIASANSSRVLYFVLISSRSLPNLNLLTPFLIGRLAVGIVTICLSALPPPHGGVTLRLFATRVRSSFEVNQLVAIPFAEISVKLFTQQGFYLDDMTPNLPMDDAPITCINRLPVFFHGCSPFCMCAARRTPSSPSA